MVFEERPQLPLTSRRKVLVAIGVSMLLTQLLGAAAVAPFVTGTDHANAAALFGLWAASIPWSTVAALLVVRQADVPDVATASFVITISAFGAFTLSAAIAARGSRAEVDPVDALFLGVTSGALTALVVWGLAQAIARVLRLPTTEGMHAGE